MTEAERRDEQVLSILRESGPMSRMNLCWMVGTEFPVDPVLRRLKASGLIHWYASTGWSAVKKDEAKQ